MRTVVWVLVLLLAAGTSAAAAEDDRQALARAHFLTGRSYYDQGRWDDALKEFSEAYRLSSRPGFLYNIGVCLDKLGRAQEAIDAFERYLAAVPNADDRADVESRIERLSAMLPPDKNKPGRPDLVGGGKPPPRRDKPVYKKAWFWGVMGGVAAVAVGGVVVGVVLADQNAQPRTLMDVIAQ
jgi:tetratricopeptide (TPR) repeat protein